MSRARQPGQRRQPVSAAVSKCGRPITYLPATMSMSVTTLYLISMYGWQCTTKHTGAPRRDRGRDLRCHLLTESGSPTNGFLLVSQVSRERLPLLIRVCGLLSLAVTNPPYPAPPTHTLLAGAFLTEDGIWAGSQISKGSTCLPMTRHEARGTTEAPAYTLPV